MIYIDVNYDYLLHGQVLLPLLIMFIFDVYYVYFCLKSCPHTAHFLNYWTYDFLKNINYSGLDILDRRRIHTLELKVSIRPHEKNAMEEDNYDVPSK